MLICNSQPTSELFLDAQTTINVYKLVVLVSCRSAEPDSYSGGVDGHAKLGKWSNAFRNDRDKYCGLCAVPISDSLPWFFFTERTCLCIFKRRWYAGKDYMLSCDVVPVQCTTFMWRQNQKLRRIRPLGVLDGVMRPVTLTASCDRSHELPESWYFRMTPMEIKTIGLYSHRNPSISNFRVPPRFTPPTIASPKKNH